VKRSVDACSIDANVIVRFLVGDDLKLSDKASNILRGVESGKTVVTCDPVNLAEVVWVLGSFYGLSNKQISDGLEPLLGAKGFLMPNKERYVKALKLFAETAPHFGDACACAAALQDCEGRLYSFDTKLSKAKGIERMESVFGE
jgi:predicted nucleic acid-binding protein